MGKSMKLSDSFYWDASGGVKKTAGNVNKLLSDVMYEMQTGISTVTLAASGHWASTAVTFPRAFSAKPVVIVSNATESTDSGMAGVNIVVCHNPAPSTTGFTAGICSDKKTTTAKTIKIAWVALVPKKAWTTKGEGGTFGGDTIQYERGKTKKGNGVGSANFPNASSGKSLWPTDTQWSIQSLAFNKTDAINNYFTIDSGSTTISGVANNSYKTVDITTSKVFKNSFVVICCVNNALTKDWHDVKCGAYTTTAIDNHNKFRAVAWNYSGASRDVGINWIAFGTVD